MIKIFWKCTLNCARDPLFDGFNVILVKLCEPNLDTGSYMVKYKSYVHLTYIVINGKRTTKLIALG